MQSTKDDKSNYNEAGSNEEDEYYMGTCGDRSSVQCPEPHLPEDTGFGECDISVAKSLLLLSPTPSCKETRVLRNGIRSSSLRESYDRILSLTKATNKELIHYLSVIERYPHKLLDCEKLSNLKFTSQDKYLPQVIYTYFALVDRYYHQMSKEQRFNVFYRYIYLFSSHICAEFSVYNLFKTFLREGFLDFFMANRYYHNFPFLREFLCDFSLQMKEKLIKIGYEIPFFRELIYNLSVRSHLCIDWIFQRWDVPCKYRISELFYRFDCALYLDDVGLRRFECVEDPAELIASELLGLTECCVCGMGDSTERQVEDHLKKKTEIRECVQEFNRSGQIIEPLAISNIRLFPSVDLKVLGDFLGKEENHDRLEEFVGTFDFERMGILDALRNFLKSFVLSGESQIIDRVVTAFATAYINQNLARIPDCTHECDLKSITARYKKVAYGFIVLNTMFYNPSFDKKPSFEDYLRLLDFSEDSFTRESLPFCPLDRESLRGYYESIKENEMKLPTVWSDSFDKYTLFLRSKESIPSFMRLSTVENTRTIEASVFYGHSICDACVKLAYRHLFKASMSSFVLLSPESFFRVCKLLDFSSGFEYYISAKKKDLEKLLESYRLYLESFIGSSAMVEGFLDSLEKTEKPKTSVLSDIKSIFSKSSADLREKAPSVLTQFSTILVSINSIRFANQDVCTANCKLLSAAMKDRRAYVRAICTNIIVGNARYINDFGGIDETALLKIVSASPDQYIDQVPDRVKVLYFKKEFEEGNITEENYKAFRKIDLFNQDSFDAYCLAHHEFDDFDRVVKIGKQEGDKGSFYEVQESYSQCMKHPRNILRFFTTSPSVLNIKVAKKIHKDSCPLDDPVFNDSAKVLYLILKCDVNDQSLFNYTSYIINYLSDSLVLLISIYESIYPVFLQVPRKLVDVAVKILTRRIKTFTENGVLCCEGVKSTDALIRMKSLVHRLVKDQLADARDLKLFQTREIAEPGVVEL